MKILAIDPALQLGFAHTKGKSIKHGSESFHNNKWDGAGMKFRKFRAWLDDFQNYDVIVYEAVEAHSSTYAAHCYGGWVAIIQEFCELYTIPYTGYAVGTIKKSFTGKGNAKKADMIKEARIRGHNVVDDNAADACAILHLALEKLSPEGRV